MSGPRREGGATAAGHDIDAVVAPVRSELTAKHEARDMIDAAREGEFPEPVRDL